ncbi:cwf21-domain-containing protein, partial [Dacryopinax primogenitus]
MYGNIGLITPRGSGTNGYVVRNLSALRPRDSSYGRADDFDRAPPRHREPDQSILEHEKRRKVEVKCMELQVELEEDGVDDEEVQRRVAELRDKLTNDMSGIAPTPVKSLKPSDTHAIAAAKKAELEKMSRALGTQSYVEGEAFNRELQEERRQEALRERERRDEQRRE